MTDQEQSESIHLPAKFNDRKLAWEPVYHAGGGTEAELLQRLKVPGGYLYRNLVVEYNNKRYDTDEYYSMAFVPEPLTTSGKGDGK